MPIHAISTGDEGIALYNGGSSPIVGREVYIYDSGWIQASQLWHCTSANPITGVYTWVQFAATDKYAPTVAPASYSLNQTLAGRPVVCSYVDQTPIGVNYTIFLYINNLTVGTGNILVASFNVGRATSGHANYFPTGWSAGDTLSGYATYEDSNGYAGPQTTTVFFTYLG